MWISLLICFSSTIKNNCIDLFRKIGRITRFMEGTFKTKIKKIEVKSIKIKRVLQQIRLI